MQVLNYVAPLIAAAAALMSSSLAASKECEQVCFGNLPCQVTEIIGDHPVDADLCAGDLVLQNGSRLIVTGDGPRLISVERTLKVIGQAEIVTQSSSSVLPKPAKAKSGLGGVTYARGPETDGPGDANAGANGGNGEDGTNGADGRNGPNPPEMTLRLDQFSGGVLKITARGAIGQDGQDGGDGGRGGDGQQGGRAIPGQPFGCRSGPGQGGRGGTGGSAGRGGRGGNGGRAANLAIEVSGGHLHEIESLVAKQILVDVSEGRHGAGGNAGSFGPAGLFGYGGRGSTGCDGREDQRKGSPGANGMTAPDGQDGQDGQPGKFVLSGRN